MTRARSLARKSYLPRRRRGKRRMLPPARRDRLHSPSGGKISLSRNASSFTVRTSIARLV